MRRGRPGAHPPRPPLLERAARYSWRHSGARPLRAVPFLPGLSQAVFVLVSVNIGLGIWVAMYLTMVQDFRLTSLRHGAVERFGFAGGRRGDVGGRKSHP